MYPLEAIKEQLRLLRLVGGLTIEPTNETVTVFKNSREGWIAVAISVAMVIVGFWIVVGTMINGGRAFFDPDLFAENGLLFTDAMCIFTLYFTNMAIMLFMIYAYWYKGRQFSKNLEAIHALPTAYIDDKDVKRIAMRSTLKVVFLYIMAVVASASCSFFGFSLWVAEDVPLWAKALFVVCFNVNCVQCYFSTVVAATHLIKYQLLGYMSLQQKAYNRCLVSHYNLEPDDVTLSGKVKIAQPKTKVIKVKPHFNENEPKDSSFYADIKLGLDIQKAIRMLNETYGSFTFLEVSNDLISAIVSIFLMSLLFAPGTYDENGTPRYVALFIGISNVPFTLQALTRFYYVMTCGQCIANGNSGIKESLKEILRTRHDQLMGTCRTDLESLLDKCSDPCPMRPLDIFDQNYSTGFSALGLCITYIVVILQFKISE